MLYKELAPITKEAWEEIEDRLMEVFKTYLSARRVVKVEGPKGLDFNVITDGRLGEIKEDGDLCYGNYQVLPLTEARVEFEMDRWELDNITRGAKDIDYEPLEKAAKKIALFEENAVYNGLESANIKGLIKSVEGETLDFGNDPNSIMESITEGLIKLKEVYQEGPFTLIVGEKAYKKIISKETSYPLEKRIEDLLGHKIVYSHVLDGALLVPYDHEDLELTIGQDLSIGYQYNDNKKVRFFITESFTFRVLDPSIIINYKL
ncbi:family 1 encapsulin nanocompartment shell protein [Clostridium sp. Cult1]|mgnify:CR=1 FL=1|uniref:family 1 encapsulin nanocompartment shell protein n=1 Tax=Clostridium sp. Cult1 TaxID=2079002 RepID=UPI001F2AD925|nr:family 1 encapsulin nanocompartment shell protein [Clostridium sp. Cult1]MCF6464084.1 bacteriocin [Clostridium sp. Cult1]